MKAIATTHKTVAYAYPSSPYARQYGFYKEGCYVVERINTSADGQQMSSIGLSGHATEQEAVEAAALNPLPWLPMTVRHNPRWFGADTLVAAIEAAGFLVSGPTDHREAEHGEPMWVCNARERIAYLSAQQIVAKGVIPETVLALLPADVAGSIREMGLSYAPLIPRVLAAQREVDGVNNHPHPASCACWACGLARRIS